MSDLRNNATAQIGVLLLFFAFVVLPGLDSSGWSMPGMEAVQQLSKQMFFGVLHPASLLFIFLSLMVLRWTMIPKGTGGRSRALVREYEDAIAALESGGGEPKPLAAVFKTREDNTVLGKIYHMLPRGASEEEIDAMLRKMTSEEAYYLQSRQNGYDYIAAVLPVLGMIGTIAGLLQMFAMPDGSASNAVDDFAKKFEGLRLALATTLYAALFTVLCVKPKSRSKEAKLDLLYAREEQLSLTARIFLHRLDYTELATFVAAESQPEEAAENAATA